MTLTPQEHYKLVLSLAAEYRRHGWYPLPLKGKAPRVKDWPNLRLSEEDLPRELREGDNLGLVLGDASGDLVDVDLDNPLAVRIAALILPHTPMRHGRQGTGLSHYWYVCKIPAPAHGRAGTRRYQAPPEAGLEKTTLIEIRYSGGQTMVPPSIHPSGEYVQWAKGGELKPTPVSAKALTEAAEHVAGLALLARAWLPGRRNEVGLWLGGWWAKAGVPRETAELWITAICAAQDDSGAVEKSLSVLQASYDRHARGDVVAGWHELAANLGDAVMRQASQWLGLGGRSGHNASLQPDWGTGADGDGPVKGKTGVNSWRYEVGLLLSLTDEGNAARFLKRHGGRVLHCELLGGWYVWSAEEGRWQLDTSHRARALARSTAREMSAEALNIETEKIIHTQDAEGRDQTQRVPAKDARALCCHWATQTASAQRLEAMLNLAACDETIALVPDQLDADALLLNCANCTLNLRPENINDPRRPHDQAYRITKLAPVAYEPDAQAPRWEQFLGEIFAGDTALIEFMRRLCGYCLFGGNPEQVIAFCWGTGANGKSTLLETIVKLLGDYASTAASETILAREGGSNNQVYALARLKGARLVTMSEADSGDRMAESLVKVMTGGEKISARFSHQNFFEYTPEFLPVMGTNHMPDLRNVDEAIRRRVLLVPFKVTIPVEDRDPGLKAALAGELSGILNWALAGLLDYYERVAEGKSGLAPPDSVRAATEEYFAGQDPIADYLDECCVLQSHLNCTKAALYKAYSEYCERSGRWCLKVNKFGALIKRKLSATYNQPGEQLESKSGSVRWWHGIGLTDGAAPPPPNELGEALSYGE